MRKTKIVCTLGPSTDDENIIRQLLEKGINSARFNFSHGNHKEHEERVNMFKKVREQLGIPVPLILDTKGPEVRVGLFKDKEINLKEGGIFILTAEELLGDENICSVSYKDLHKFVCNGDKILINDGLVELRVEKTEDSNIYCYVVKGGAVGNRKSIHIPGVDINLPPLTLQDIEDIKFAIRHDFDFIAASFVRKASDITEMRKILQENRGDNIRIIAKVESKEGIDNIDEIIELSDGIMVARGDLGVEIPPEDVPAVQKNLIAKCRMVGKPVIIATHMLESMIWNARPTRAEASDVANAVYDGASAVMLSGETAAGKYPVESLETMARIIKKTEMSIDYKQQFKSTQYAMSSNVTNAISHATCAIADDLAASAIITVTKSGYTASKISRFRPSCSIIACTMCEKIQRQLFLYWGIYPLLTEKLKTMDGIFDNAVKVALDSGLVKRGDMVVITAGTPVDQSGTTNILKAQRVC